MRTFLISFLLCITVWLSMLPLNAQEKNVTSGFFRDWHQLIRRCKGDELLLLERIQALTTKMVGDNVDDFMDKFIEQQGVYTPRTFGEIEDKIVLVSPFIRFKTPESSYSLEITVSEVKSPVSVSVKPVLTKNVGQNFYEWLRRKPFTHGGFLAVSAKYAADTSHSKGYDILQKVSIHFDKFEAFSSDLSAYAFVVEFTTLDARTLPAKTMEQAFHAYTGLRDAYEPSGDLVKKNGRVLRKDFGLRDKIIARTANGIPIFE